MEKTQGNQMVTRSKPTICWWSGGATSAVACKLAIELFGVENVRLVFIDTFNEDDDTYRFLMDCEDWYGNKIEQISAIGGKFKSIKDVWYHFKSLNVAHGAICSATLKRDVRLMFEKTNPHRYQVFGFDIDEPKRAKAMALNYEDANPIFPLLLFGYTKKKCIDILRENGIEIPRAYKLGLNNNNCLKTGCVQGGIGYWQMMRHTIPENFYNMAKVEHELTDLVGHPVTMLKDQSKNGGLVFLLPHPDYPHVKDISMMKGRPPKPLVECNGFCRVNDLADKSETELELNLTPTI